MKLILDSSLSFAPPTRPLAGPCFAGKACSGTRTVLVFAKGAPRYRTPGLEGKVRRNAETSILTSLRHPSFHWGLEKNNQRPDLRECRSIADSQTVTGGVACLTLSPPSSISLSHLLPSSLLPSHFPYSVLIYFDFLLVFSVLLECV